METIVVAEYNDELVLEIGQDRISAAPVADDGECVLLVYRDVRGKWRFQRATLGGGDRIELRGNPMTLGQLPAKWLQQISRQRLPSGCPVPPLGIAPRQLDLFEELPWAPITLAVA